MSVSVCGFKFNMEGAEDEQPPTQEEMQSYSEHQAQRIASFAVRFLSDDTKLPEPELVHTLPFYGYLQFLTLTFTNIHFLPAIEHQTGARHGTQ